MIQMLFPEETAAKRRPALESRRTADVPQGGIDAALKKASDCRIYHVIPDIANPFKARVREDAKPAVCRVDLRRAGSAEKQEERIRGYMSLEKLRGFREDEVPLRLTELVLSEDRSDLLITWDARFISEKAVDWLL